MLMNSTMRLKIETNEKKRKGEKNNKRKKKHHCIALEWRTEEQREKTKLFQFVFRDIISANIKQQF